MITPTLVIEHLEELYLLAGPAPRAGTRQGDHQAIHDGAVGCAGERIVAVGTTADVRKLAPPSAATRVIDARGRSLVPGFVDGHTHVVFAGDRRQDRKSTRLNSSH